MTEPTANTLAAPGQIELEETTKENNNEKKRTVKNISMIFIHA